MKKKILTFSVVGVLSLILFFNLTLSTNKKKVIDINLTTQTAQAYPGQIECGSIWNSGYLACYYLAWHPNGCSRCEYDGISVCWISGQVGCY